MYARVHLYSPSAPTVLIGAARLRVKQIVDQGRPFSEEEVPPSLRPVTISRDGRPITQPTLTYGHKAIKAPGSDLCSSRPVSPERVEVESKKEYLKDYVMHHDRQLNYLRGRRERKYDCLQSSIL